jgi:hypothetical protein
LSLENEYGSTALADVISGCCFIRQAWYGRITVGNSTYH